MTAFVIGLCFQTGAGPGNTIDEVLEVGNLIPEDFLN